MPMKTFLHEYGMALFCMICVIFLTCTSSPVSAQVRTGMENVVKTVDSKITDEDSGLLADGSSVIDKSMREMNILNANYEMKYYSSLDKANADINNFTTDNADSTENEAVVAVGINKDVNTAQLKLLKDAKLTSTVKYSSNVLINLNGKTLSAENGSVIQYLKDLRVENGTLDFNESSRVITGAISQTEQATGEFMADNVKFVSNTTNGRSLNLGGSSKDIKINNCTFDVMNMHAIYAVPTNATVEITNCKVTNTCATQSSGMFVGGNKVIIKNNVINTKSLGIYASNVQNLTMENNDVKVNANNNKLAPSALYLLNTNAVVNSGSFSTTNEGQAISIFASGSKLIVNNAKVRSNAGETTNISSGLYAKKSSIVTVNDIDIKGNGKNAFGIVVINESELYIHGGTIYASPWLNPDTKDIKGAGLAVSSKAVIDENNEKVVISGGNAGINMSAGANITINGGTFKSPSHGGAYVSCGSTGKFEVNGGTFCNNRNEFDSKTVEGIPAYGGMYVGTSSTTEKWSINIRNARIINECGDQGLVQKSNDGYIPATINLYDTYISGKKYDVVTQNNASVGTYDAYINLYKGTVLAHNSMNDNYGKAVGKDYIIDHR